jgi:addiction module RelE/StbE family toxin
MRRLSWDSSFRRAFKQQTRRDRILRERIFEVLDQLARDPFLSTLKTHKLSGQLQGLWACWVEYDCRIIFAFETEPQTGEELIVLIDLGTHDDVY